jgi:GNAT superfamily N-acetyltransferase
MSPFTTKPLDETTWPDFARLVERHHGVWGGCWCTAFHAKGEGEAENRRRKECLVREGRTHAALVYDGERCVGWCQFGSPEELPRIKHRRAYLQDLVALPDWRITCFFVDKEYRGRGVAHRALEGAQEQIARLGGGTVESYPERVEDRKTAGAFLHNGTLAMFERQGFVRVRPLGKHHWVVAKVVPLARLD